MEILFWSRVGFELFLNEIYALGFTVSDAPQVGARPYGVIGGRSIARWWLVPLANRHVATSGLALFQPIIPSSKILKRTATALNFIGLSSLWARKRVYVTCPPAFSDLFGNNNLSYAFFTGTDSPHRKTAIQIMGDTGEIKGIAKVSSNVSVKPLLKHEAEMLNYLNRLDLKTALIPKVLFCGEINGSEVLVTDSLKTARTKTLTTLSEEHIDFLREVAEKTTVPKTDFGECFLAALRNKYQAVAEKLTDEWRQRLEKAIGVIAGSVKALGTGCLAHGDFTPWNTFLVDGKLYVFDWEYANHTYPRGYDMIHFMLSRPQTNRRSAAAIVKKVIRTLSDTGYASSNNAAKALLMTYLCGHTLQYVGRALVGRRKVSTWDGADMFAEYIDFLIGADDLG